MKMALFKVTRFFLYGVLRILFRFRVVGADHLLPGQAVLYAANHESFLDGFLIAVALPHPVRFIVTTKYWINRVLVKHFHFLGIEPGKSPIKAIRQTIRSLEAGESLVIFPEGTIRRVRGRSIPPKSGITAIALKAEVPVIPVAVVGTRSILEPGKWWVRLKPAWVMFAKPIPPSPTRKDSELTHQIMHTIFEMRASALAQKPFRASNRDQDAAITRYSFPTENNKKPTPGE